MKSKIELFFCSALEDESFHIDLEKHLQIFQRYGLVNALWSSQHIVPGAEVDQEIDRYLDISQLILLLVSPSFLSSDDCYKIILRAMDRHERGTAQVIPIILRPVDWKDAPFGKLKVLPTNENPLTSWPDRDAALYDVAVSIRQVIEQWAEKAAPNLLESIENITRPVVALDASNEFSFALVRTLTEHLGPVASVAFSSDGQFLISDSWDNTIKIWNRDVGSALYTWRGHEGAVYSVGFSPDMRIIASGSDDCTVRLWETSSRRLLATLLHNGPVSSVALSADSRILASGSDDCTVGLWEISSGRRLMTLGHIDPVSSVALSADSKILVSGGYDQTIQVWDIRLGRVIQTLRGHVGPVSSVALSDDSKILVSGSHDQTIKVWDMPSGQERLTLVGHSGPVSSIALSSDAETLVSGSYDKTVKVWKIATGQLLKDLMGHTEAVLSVALHPDGNIIASGSLDKTIKIWQKPLIKHHSIQPAHHERSEQVARYLLNDIQDLVDIYNVNIASYFGIPGKKTEQILRMLYSDIVHMLDDDVIKGIGLGFKRQHKKQFKRGSSYLYLANYIINMNDRDHQGNPSRFGGLISPPADLGLDGEFDLQISWNTSITEAERRKVCPPLYQFDWNPWMTHIEPEAIIRGNHLERYRVGGFSGIGTSVERQEFA